MKRRLQPAVVLIVLFLVGGVAAAPPEAPPAAAPEVAEKLQAALDGALAATGTMGVTAAVILPDGTLWTGVSGLSHPGVPVTPDMLFDMGSTGKNLMAALVLDLVDDGLLSLDDPVSRYLPPFPNVDGRITIRQLLNHTSGLFMWVEHPDSPINTPFDQIEFERWWTLGEMFSELGGEPYFAPGEGWHYTQAGYQLARLIVEKVTGSPAPAEMQRRLLDPLGINGMLLDMTEPVSPEFRIAHPWFDADGDGTPDDIFARSRNWINSLSGIYYFTTMESLARWLRGLYDGRVLSPTALEEMLDFYGPLPEAGLAGYGLGTEHFVMGGLDMWGHKGSIYGYRTGAYHLPQHGITIALSINTSSDEKGYAMFGALVEVLLGGARDGNASEPQGPYLGQAIPANDPVKFAPGVVSTEAGNHSSVAIGPDGKEICWESGGKLWSSRHDDGSWGKPEMLSFCAEDPYMYGNPFISPDGKRLYYTAIRPGAAETVKEAIWFAVKGTGGWEDARPLSFVINELPLHWSISVSSSGTVYFQKQISKDDRVGGVGDIYCSTLRGDEHTTPVALGPEINTEHTETCPYVAPDESYLIFNRFNHTDMSKTGIYISFRDDTGEWLPAVFALGGSPERGGMSPKISPDGKFLFFARGRDGVWWMRADFLWELRSIDLTATN